MKTRWLPLISMILTATLVFPTACSLNSDNATPTTQAPPANSENVAVFPTTQAPLVDFKNVSETSWDIAGTLKEVTISSQKGGTVEQGEASILVPAGALPEDSVVSIKELLEPPPSDMPSEEDATLPTGVSISRVYDLGPAGITFDKPVQVTLAYDKSLLDAGVDASRIQAAYYDGKNWIAAGGLVDTDKGTVTISAAAFPGVYFTTIVVAGIMIGALTWAGSRAYDYLKGDPIKNGNAKDYITPDNPTVIDYTKRSGALKDVNGVPKWVEMEDPNNPGKLNPAFKDFIKTAYQDKSCDNRIGFDGGPRSQPSHPNFSDAKNFQMPEDFFQNGMSGDCTAVACAYASMLLRLGIKAYAVDGEKSNTAQGGGRHAWVEFYLDGKVYYYDNEEGIKPLEDVEKTLDRHPAPTGESYMWDKNGQQIYQKEWWKALSEAPQSETPQPETPQPPAQTPTTPPDQGTGWYLDGNATVERNPVTEDCVGFRKMLTVVPGEAIGVLSWKDCSGQSKCSGSYTGNVTWTPPPSFMKAGSDVSLAMSAKTTVNNTCGSLNIGSGGWIKVGNETIVEVSDLEPTDRGSYPVSYYGSPGDKLFMIVTVKAANLLGFITYSYTYK